MKAAGPGIPAATGAAARGFGEAGRAAEPGTNPAAICGSASSGGSGIVRSCAATARRDSPGACGRFHGAAKSLPVTVNTSTMLNTWLESPPSVPVSTSPELGKAATGGPADDVPDPW
jgi:hypothetical protein